MPVIQIDYEVNLRVCQQHTFPLPCRGVITHAQFSADKGSWRRNWAMFRPYLDDGSLGSPCNIRMYKIDGAIPDASHFGWKPANGQV